MRTGVILAMLGGAVLLGGCNVKDWLYGTDKTEQPGSPDAQLSQRRICNKVLSRVVTYQNKMNELTDASAGSYKLQLKRQYYYDRMTYFTDLSFKLNCNRLKFADMMLKADPIGKLFPDDVSETTEVGE